jgi:hypothetical protein
MKKIIVLSMMLMSTLSYACLNLSGTYVTAENKVYTNRQTDCESMTTTDESTSMTLIFDNKEYLFYELENIQVFIKSRLEGDRFIYEERQITKLGNGSVTEDLHWSEVFFDHNLDLITRLHRANGTIENYLDKRF